jgi:D-alanyl-D-alanine carboxypeptidase
MILLLIAAAFAASLPATNPAPTISAAQRQQIDTLVGATMRHQHLPGMSLAIARNGAVLYASGYGYRDVQKRLPADSGTVYNIASMTKQFTATAILLLQEDGKLSVGDSLARYLPDYRYARQITLREMLNHTSGIPDYSIVENVPHRATAAQFVDLIKDTPLDFPPGSRFEYSNTNYVILGMIVEKVSGESYGDFLARRVFQPLGMHATSARMIPQDVPDGAVGYTYADGKIVTSPQTADDLGYGDGTIDSSVTDLVRWDAALDNGRVLNRSSWSAMTFSPLSHGYGMRGGYGFGLDLAHLYGRRYIFHQGLNGGFAGENATFPDDGLEIAALSNGDPFDEDLFFRRVVSIVEPPTAAEAAADLESATGQDPVVTKKVMSLLAAMQRGTIDREAVTADYAHMLTPAAARQMCADAGVVGTPRRVIYRGRTYRDRKDFVFYDVYYPDSVVAVDAGVATNGALSLIEVARED